MNYQEILKYFPFANAVYGKNDANPTPIPVGNSAPVVVENFASTAGSGFDGALYKNPATGKYTLAFAGSVQLGPDWLQADPILAAQRITALTGEWIGSWHPQMTDALNFAYAAVRQIRTDLKAKGNDNPTMDDIRAVLDVTGHSLGGALAEVVAKFFGLPGANIDGPGVSTLVGLSNFTQMQNTVAADSDLPGFQSNYVLQPGAFTANAFSIVGMAGTHLDGTNFDAETKASASFYAGSTLVVLGLQTGGLASLAGLGVLVNSVTDHPMGGILGKIEQALNIPTVGSLPTIDSVGLGNAPFGGLGTAPELDLFYKTPGATTYAVAAKWVVDTQMVNVAAGLSPSGIPLDGTAVVKGSYTVIAFRDEATGRVNEFYTPTQGGTTTKREFAVAADGQVGTFTQDGKLQFVVSTADNSIAVAELQLDNRLLVSSFDAKGVSQAHLFTPDVALAASLRSGAISLQQHVTEFANHLFGQDPDTSLTVNGQKMQAVQLERNGLNYLANADGEFVRGLGGGVKDVIDGVGKRFLQDADGNRTPINSDQTIAVSDAGAASIVSRAVIGNANPNGLPQVFVFQENGIATRIDLDAAGQLLRTSKLQVFDDGSFIGSTTYPDGSATSFTTNADGSLFQKSVATPGANGTLNALVTNGVGQLVSTIHTDFFYDETGISRIETVTTAAGTVRNVYNNDNTLFSSIPLPSTGPSNADLSSAANAAVDLINFSKAIASGASAGYTFATGIVLLNKQLNPAGSATQFPNFGTAATIAGGALSLYNLNQAFSTSGNELGKFSATANGLNFANQALLNSGLGGSTALANTLNGTGIVGGTVGILPAIGLITSIKSGDPIGIAQSAIALFNPALLFTSGVGFTPLGWFFVGATILQAVFAPKPPKAWGVANVSYGEGFNNLALQVNASGDSFGTERARSGLQNIVTYLQTNVVNSYNNTHDASHQVGLIAQRLPGLAWRASDAGDPGYKLTDIDPLTGEQKYPYRRFDDNGAPFTSNAAAYQVDPTDPNQRGNMGQALVMSAYNRQAIAPLWEVRTAKLQGDAGAVNAGLGEEERAAKAGLSAALDSAYANSHTQDATAKNKRIGSFMAVAMDMNNSGTITTGTIAQEAGLNNGQGISFNWDDQSYQKKVGWVGDGSQNTDAFLVLDRNFNQSVDNGTELLSNPLVADPAKGLRSLATWDADGDGRITAADPIYHQLKVWQDFDCHYEQCSYKQPFHVTLGAERLGKCWIRTSKCAIVPIMGIKGHSIGLRRRKGAVAEDFAWAVAA